MSVEIGRIDDTPEGRMNVKRFHLVVAQSYCCPDGCKRQPCEAGEHLAQAKDDCASAPVIIFEKPQGED